MKFMKKYESPELTMITMHTQNIMESSNPIPPIHGGDAVKDFDFEDISSDLFGNESFGGAEEW